MTSTVCRNVLGGSSVPLARVSLPGEHLPTRVSEIFLDSIAGTPCTPVRGDTVTPLNRSQPTPGTLASVAGSPLRVARAQQSSAITPVEYDPTPTAAGAPMQYVRELVRSAIDRSASAAKRELDLLASEEEQGRFEILNNEFTEFREIGHIAYHDKKQIEETFEEPRNLIARQEDRGRGILFIDNCLERFKMIDAFKNTAALIQAGKSHKGNLGRLKKALPR